MSPEKSSGTSFITPRNLLIGGGILAIVGIAGVAALAIGAGRNSVVADNSATGFSDTATKTARAAPNVKQDYNPTPDKAADSVAPKTLESKNTSAADNTMVASVKDKGTTVAKDNNPLNVIAYGSPSAPVTIVEYGSFSCSHCAAFEQEEFPKIKETYIDKGLVRLVYRPFSRNGVDVLAGLLVTCLQPERRAPMIELLFHQQNSWIPWDAPAEQQQTEITNNLKSYGIKAGLTEQTADQCLKDTKNQAWLQTVLAQGNKDGVEGTPTFFVNGKKYSNMPWDEWKTTLNALLPKTD